MTFEALSKHLDAFLALKSARARRSPHFEGDQRRRLRYEEGLLRSFLARWQQHGGPWPIRADFAVDWVMEGSTIGRPYRDEHRLLAIRAFLMQVRTFEGQTGVPQIQFCRRYKRRTPYIFSDREIQQMMEATVRNQSPFRTATVRTLIGLLASTGIRIGEALRLTTADVRFDATPPHLYIHETKFGKSRNVVLHPSTVRNLQHSGGHWGTIPRFRDQMERLLGSAIATRWSGEESDGRRATGDNLLLADSFDLWWTPQQLPFGKLPTSSIVLSQGFFDQMVAAPIPLDLRAVRALKRSPLALDLYAWATRRVSYLNRSIVISGQALRLSFGAGYADTPQGKSRFRANAIDALRRVSVVYPQLNWTAQESGLALRPSSAHILKLTR